MNGSVRVGVTLPQFGGEKARFIDAARRAEALGFDSIWVFDHLWPLGARERPILEGWSSVAHLAVATERISIGTLVTRSSLRHPAVLAKMAATVEHIAPGRLIIGVGSGDDASRPENEAFGIPYHSGAERIHQLGSTVAVLAAALGGAAVTATDRFVALDGYSVSPRPEPSPALWVGGWSEEVLDMAAARASGWNGWMGTPKRYRAASARLLASAGGREVVPTWGGQVILARTEEAARKELGERSERAFVVGDPAGVAARLGEFVAAGARHLVIAFPRAAAPEPFELLATEVRPLLEG